MFKFCILLFVILLDVKVSVNDYPAAECHSIMVTGNVAHRHCHDKGE